MPHSGGQSSRRLAVRSTGFAVSLLQRCRTTSGAVVPQMRSGKEATRQTNARPAKRMPVDKVAAAISYFHSVSSVVLGPDHEELSCHPIGGEANTRSDHAERGGYKRIAVMIAPLLVAQNIRQNACSTGRDSTPAVANLYP